MTPIQAQSLPIVLEGRDLLAQAKTGSGKTVAFALGLLHTLETRTYRTQALVLCPTRELADQVSKEIRRLARATPNTRVVTLCGGKPLGPQLASLKKPPHIVVGTPGRILKLLEKGALQPEGLKTLVLDEADRMLDMGFHEDIMRIIDSTPRHRQTLLFSATYPDAIQEISHAIQNDPVDIRVESSHHNEHIKQVFYEIEKGERTSTLGTLLQHSIIAPSPAWCSAIAGTSARNWPMSYGNRVSMHWPCTEIWIKKNATRCWYSLPIKAVPFWSQQMLLHVDWTSRTCRP